MRVIEFEFESVGRSVGRDFSNPGRLIFFLKFCASIHRTHKETIGQSNPPQSATPTTTT